MNNAIRYVAVGPVVAALIVAAGPTPIIVNAADMTDQVTEASKSGAVSLKLRLSQDGHNAMRDIRATRIAISNGDTEGAKTFVEQVEADLAKVEKEEDVAMGMAPTGESGNLIAIDRQLVVVGNLVATPKRTLHVAGDNQNIEEGEHDNAIRSLTQANVEIGFTRILMPLDKTEAHVDYAADLIRAGSLSEANMALKAAEDGLKVETIMLAETPTANITANIGQVQPTATLTRKAQFH